MNKIVMREKQPLLKYKNIDSRIVEVEIFLDENEITYPPYNDKSYEYSYNHFVTENSLDEKTIMDNIRSYLNYPPKEKDKLEQLRADIDYLMMFVE